MVNLSLRFVSWFSTNWNSCQKLLNRKKLLHSFSSRNRLKIVYSSNQSLKETWLFHNCYHDEQNFGDEVQNWIICFVLLVKLDDLNEWKVFIVKAKQQKVCTCRFSSLGHKKVQKYLSSLPLSTSHKHSVLFQTFLTQNSLFILLKNFKI